jgi:hypothetical protein
MNDLKNQGWVRFYRKSMNSTTWKNPIIWFVWSWCMLKANHEDNKFPFNGTDIMVKRGSFISGLLSAQKELPTLSTQNIRTVFNYLKSTGRITIKSNTKFSLITIVKWEEYQQDNRQTNKPLTNQQQTTNKPLTTNKNVKNDKNEKKDIVAFSDTPFSLKEEIKKLEDSPRRELNIIALYFDNRKPDLQNKAQYEQALKRHLKPAIALKPFTDTQILKAVDYAKKEYKDIYTIETLIKILVK